MLKRILNTMFAAVAVIAACLVAIEFPSISNTIQAQTEKSKLALELSASKNSYVQLEPVEFNFKLSNKSGEPVKWQGLLMLGSDLDFLVTSPGGEEKRIEGRKMSLTAVASAPSVLEVGGEAKSYAVLGGVEEQENVFSKAGVYQIRIEFRYQETTGGEARQTKIVSNPITINITAPQGIDLEAYNYIKNTLEKARTERASADETAALRQNFVNLYGSSVYAKYEIFKLALAYRAGGEELKSLRELCKISGENFAYTRNVQKTTELVYAKLSPPEASPLSDGSIAQRPEPCVWLQRQPKSTQ